jgi:putative membrane protein
MKKLDLRKHDESNSKLVLNKAKLSEHKEQTTTNVVEIIKRDFKSSYINPIVLLVLLGVILLPSLYGLVNIYACWDPYEETGNVQFAIANIDNGSEYQGETVNVGQKLVDSLKDNHDFEWVFVSQDELKTGVHNGKYYAGIIIPENFSDSVVSITSGDPHSAE